MSDQEIKVDDCWNQIGVWAYGHKSCPRLKDVVHCANCDVFSDAGRRLLEREAPRGYLEDWQSFISETKEERVVGTQSTILFRLGDEWLGLTTALLDEVVPMRAIHRVPHRKSSVLKGLTNVRGELQLCVSMGRLLNITRGEISGTNVVKGIYERMVVMSFEGQRYVFPVSEIRGVHRYSREDVLDAPATAINCSVHYLKGILDWEGKHVGLIDHELLFPALARGIL